MSLVVPMYNEEEGVGIFFERVLPILERITPDFEIICVNDGSRDGTFELLLRWHESDGRIKIIDLSRNFGKEVALSAGLDHVTGDAVVPLDADLQDPPEVIPDLVEKWREGFDVVIAVRGDRRGDSRFKRLSAHAFYRVMGRIGDIPIPADAGDFRLMDRRVVEALERLPERTRFMKGLFAWLGFRQATITYSRPARAAGSSKWRVWKLWNFALEGIFSFTTLPLRIWTYVGLTTALGALVYMMLVIVQRLAFGTDVPGYASIVVILLFSSGLNMVGLGIIGEYLGRVFMEVKCRPLYLVQGTVGIEPEAPVDGRMHGPAPGRPRDGRNLQEGTRRDPGRASYR